MSPSDTIRGMTNSPPRRRELHAFRLHATPRPGPRRARSPRKPRRVDVLCADREAAELGISIPPDERLEPIRAEPWQRLLTATRPSGEERIDFFEAVGGALRAGSGVDEALELAAQSANSPALRGIIGSLRRSVRCGGGFAEALAGFPDCFPPMVVAMVRAAETAGGDLGRVLCALAERGRREDRLRRKFINAVAYPCVVLLLTIAAALVLQLRALPPMVENFRQLGATLPAPTRLLYAVSKLLLEDGWWIAGSLGLAAFLAAKPLRWWFRTERAQQLVLRTPLIGPILRGLSLVRALNTFAMLKACGASTDQQFRHAADAAGNPVYGRFFLALHERVISGEELHEACLAERDMIPGDDGLRIAGKLRLGAFSGEGAPLIQALADELNERTDLRASLLPQALEIPLLLLCGSVIASIILAMLLPMPSLVIDMLKRPGGF